MDSAVDQDEAIPPDVPSMRSEEELIEAGGFPDYIS